MCSASRSLPRRRMFSGRQHARCMVVQFLTHSPNSQPTALLTSGLCRGQARDRGFVLAAPRLDHQHGFQAPTGGATRVPSSRGRHVVCAKARNHLQSLQLLPQLLHLQIMEISEGFR